MGLCRVSPCTTCECRACSLIKGMSLESFGRSCEEHCRLACATCVAPVREALLPTVRCTKKVVLTHHAIDCISPSKQMNERECYSSTSESLKLRIGAVRHMVVLSAASPWLCYARTASRAGRC